MKRSPEDQIVLDSLMERDDWQHLLAHGTRHISNLTANQKRIIGNYKTYLWNINPLNREKRKQTLSKYRRSERCHQNDKQRRRLDKFKETRKKYSERDYVRKKKSAHNYEYKRRPEVKEKLKEYFRTYQTSTEVKARRNAAARLRRLKNKIKI